MMEYKKSLFGRAVIESSDYDDVSDDIELEYYETHNIAGENNRKYGIEVVKREEKSEKFNIESKIVNNLSNEEKTVKKLLNTLMMYKVTPTTVDDIISDIKSM